MSDWLVIPLYGAIGILIGIGGHIWNRYRVRRGQKPTFEGIYLFTLPFYWPIALMGSFLVAIFHYADNYDVRLKVEAKKRRQRLEEAEKLLARFEGWTDAEPSITEEALYQSWKVVRGEGVRRIGGRE